MNFGGFGKSNPTPVKESSFGSFKMQTADSVTGSIQETNMTSVAAPQTVEKANPLPPNLSKEYLSRKRTSVFHKAFTDSNEAA
jgi:hypothetical protein